MPAFARHQAADCSGSSHVANGTGDLPCLRRLNRSSSAAATTWPSMTRAAAGSWKSALIPRTRIEVFPSSDSSGRGRGRGHGTLGGGVRRAYGVRVVDEVL